MCGGGSVGVMGGSISGVLVLQGFTSGQVSAGVPGGER